MCALQVVEDANGLPTVRMILSIYSSAGAAMGAAASRHSGQQPEGDAQVRTADGLLHTMGMVADPCHYA